MKNSPISISRGSLLAAGAVAATTVALVGFALWSYRLSPSPGAVFLVTGWLSILACALFLGRAVLAAAGTEAEVPEVSATGQDRKRGDLLAEKNLLLKAIKEVEFDRATEKMDDADAAEATARFRARALEIMESLDQAQSSDDLQPKPARSSVRGPCACGTANDADAVFCKKCGAKIK